MGRRPRRNRANKLERWEVSLVKRLIATQDDLNDQDILAYFTRPARSINHSRIGDIRSGAQHAATPEASQAELNAFLQSWPDIDPKTGLHIRGDELLIKAREAMLSAVQAYNDPRTYFKSELFIVTAVIAYTYLLHWYYHRQNVDIRYKRVTNGVEETVKTRHGADKHWELESCLDYIGCPLLPPVKTNLRFLIAIRHEIEHQLTNRIDDTISAKLQACSLNFNSAIKDLAGMKYGLDSELNFALQFCGIEREQRDILLQETGLPPNILAAHSTFEDALDDDMMINPLYSYRVAYIEQSVNSKGKADQVVEFIKADSERGEQVRRTLKETERAKLKPKQIVLRMRQKGFARFTITKHAALWKAQDAKNPNLHYGVKLLDGQWYWYPSWVDFVEAYLEEHRVDYE